MVGCLKLLFALLEEFVLKMKYYRTGQKWQHRVCPKHAVELELCINDTDYSMWSREFQTTLANQDNRVAWRCDECIGYWFENHFIDCAEWSRPYLIERAQLVVSCPNCSSRRVTHTCEPACCGVHECLDCNATLESHVEVVHEGEKTSRPRLRLRGQGWNASGPFSSDHMLRTGVRRDYRTCKKEHERMMELVLIDPIGICDAQVGWYCDDCERVDYEVGGMRSIRFGFIHEARPGAVCPACGSEGLDSADCQPERCRCVSCGAEIAVTMVSKDPPADSS